MNNFYDKDNKFKLRIDYSKKVLFVIRSNLVIELDIEELEELIEAIEELMAAKKLL